MSARTIVLAAGLVLGVAACTERAPPLAPATDPEPRATYVGTPCVFTVSGSTMTLTADCTTETTIQVTDGFTLDGAGHTITAVSPTAGNFLGAVVKNAGATAHVTNLTVVGAGLGGGCLGAGPPDNRLRGILFAGASGSITGNVVQDIHRGPNGCQEGNGIEVRNAPFDGTHPSTKSVLVSDNVVTGYQKTGILANGDVAVTIEDNSVTGLGPVPFIAQNGIQVGFGGTGTVRRNAIAGNFYTGCSNRDAAKTGCVPFVSAGLLLFNIEAKAVRASHNRFRDNQFNVLLINSQSLNPGPP